MKGDNLGELEESVAMGAVHVALSRLEEKGFLSSQLAQATHARGGRRKRLFTVTAEGKKALERNLELRNQLWSKIPEITWKHLGFERL